MEQIKEYFPHALLDRYGASVPEAARSAEAAVEGVIARLEAMTPAQLNAPVAEGKWTPLEVADHLHRVTLIAVQGLEAMLHGEEPVRHERGWVTADGSLAVHLPGAEPHAGQTLEDVVRNLRSSTRLLHETAEAAAAAGFGGAVANVNPYFGELTPLASVQMAALHARHHVKRHLSLVGA